jgi:hypothetical protein
MWMLANTSRLLRLSLIAAMATAAVAAPVHPSAAWAQDEDDDDEGDDGGDDDGGDDDGGGDDDESADDEEEVEEGQPAVTAGGLFTLKTYPQGELQRPLTITKGITEVKAGLGVDMSAAHAFESVGALVEGRYGIEDNLELQGGFKGIYNFSQIEAFVGVEGSLMYDLVDFRVAPRLSYCSPRTEDQNGVEVFLPPGCIDNEKDAALHFDVGFPFRYAPKPQVGVIALDTLITIDTEDKPDLAPSVGIIVQPLPVVAVLLEAQILIRDFDTDADNFQVPATLTVQFSPTNLIDLGLEFTLNNVKQKEEARQDDMGKNIGGPFTDRFLTIYGQLRL